ncbi:type II toxin-antitoxin system VapC family toxin [Granulicella tundricola]
MHVLPDLRIGIWMYAQPESSLYLSVMTIGELRKGTTLLPEGKRRRQLEQWLDHELVPRFHSRILPITQTIADHWGILSARRQRQGAPLSMADGLIAATALHHNLTVVTRNIKDFTDLGVPLLNPWESNQP